MRHKVPQFQKKAKIYNKRNYKPISYTNIDAKIHDILWQIKSRNICIIAIQGWAQEGKVVFWYLKTSQATHYVDDQKRTTTWWFQGKALDKIQYPFTIIFLSKPGIHTTKKSVWRDKEIIYFVIRRRKLNLDVTRGWLNQLIYPL